MKSRVVAKDRADGSTEIFLQDPQSGREVRTGHVVRREDRDKAIRDTKEVLDRKGHEVHVHEERR